MQQTPASLAYSIPTPPSALVLEWYPCPGPGLLLRAHHPPESSNIIRILAYLHDMASIERSTEKTSKNCQGVARQGVAARFLLQLDRSPSFAAP